MPMNFATVEWEERSSRFFSAASFPVSFCSSSNLALSLSVSASGAEASADKAAVTSVESDRFWGLDLLRLASILGLASGATGTIADEVFFSDVFSASD